MKSQVSPKALTNLKKQAENVAGLLKQLSHTQRLLILCNLADGEKTVSEIEAACDASQSAVSQFLKAMRLEGLVEARREGPHMIYKIKDKRLLELLKSLYLIFC